jgi:predicted outer membrane repeat protein
MGKRVKFTLVAVVCALVVGLSVTATAKIIYIDDDAKQGGSGSSWANAFSYLQTALTVANTGDEIRVAQGLYRPDQGLLTQPTTRGRPASTPAGPVFQLKSGVALLGGFAGVGAPDPNARDVERHESILSGDLHGNDVELWGPGSPVYEFLQSDNSLYVIQSTATDATAVLDGFVVESAVQSSFLNQGGSPRIANCIFQKGSGVALRCEGGQPTLVNCVFQENGSAKSSGSAITAMNSRLTLKNCRFLGNSAGHEGGAIYGMSSDFSLTGCTFERNAAYAGGAIHQTAGTLTLVDCTFEGNAAQEGGAVAFAVEKAAMTRCVFKDNWAITWGGALENGGAPLTLDQCTFTGNMANLGGALYAARLTAATAAPGFVTTMTRCIFAGNYASSVGGALYHAQMELTILHCTFTGNRAGTCATLAWPDAGASAVVYPIGLENCIVWDGGQSIAPYRAVRASRGSTSQVTTAQNVVIRYSDVQGGWAGEGNINIDPYFAASGYWGDAVDPAVPVTSDYSSAIWIDGDYHVKSEVGRWDPIRGDWVRDEVASPCIDAGDPSSPVADEPQPNGGRVNMGAYGGTAEASKSYQAPQASEPPVSR